jgi:hypothetical protein
MAQQDPSESSAENKHGHEAPKLNQQGQAPLTAQFPATGHLG